MASMAWHSSISGARKGHVCSVTRCPQEGRSDGRAAVLTASQVPTRPDTQPRPPSTPSQSPVGHAAPRPAAATEDPPAGHATSAGNVQQMVIT